MSPDEWDRIRQLFHDALDLPPEDRQAWLEGACDDPRLRAEVESLLETQEEPSDILSGPAWEGLPGVIEAAAARETARDPLVPGILLKDRYLLERRLGQGGFGTVFLASDQQLHARPVVVKALLEENSSDPWFQKRFAEEIRTLAAIDHPGVVAILDSGQTDSGVLFLVMQFAEGATLRTLIPARGMPFGRAAGLVRQMAEALGAAHEKGVIHQDLKPENVMVQRLPGDQERVRLIDFGIARLKSDTPDTSSDISRVAGSPSYMAPEHLGGHASVASDVYSLGVVAYEMLTGGKPFAAQNPVQLFQMQSAGEMIAPRSLRQDLPPAAERALLKALAFQAADRPASAVEFARELSEALASGAALSAIAGAEAAPRTDSRPIAHDVFLSHASRDRELAARLVAALERRGIRCFIACRDLMPDDLFPEAVGGAMNRSGCCVLVLTDAANASVQLSREVQLALAASTPVLTVRLDGAETSEELAFYMGQSRWIDASADLDAADLERIERAIRAEVPQASRQPERECVPVPPANDSGEPLFSEFGAIPGFLRPGLRRVRLMAIFGCWALLTCVLSTLANTAYITVFLQAPQSQSMISVRFGYLYELNSAFAYLLVVPWFVYFSVGFVMEAQVALSGLSSRDQIVPNRPRAPSRPRAAPSPLELVAEAHRRWMSRSLWIFTLAMTLLVVVGTEFLPPKSDYKHVMFGYVQAPWIAEYPERCPNCTLNDLERRLERRIEPQGVLTARQLGSYRIAGQLYRRSGTAVERMAFVLFMVSVLGLEVALGMFVFWTVFNAFFFLQLIYRAITPLPSSTIGLHLRYTDPARVFGLEPVHRALRQLVATICVSTILPVVSWWTNFMKGSRRALGQDLYSLGGWGQFLISNGSFVMAVALLVYLVSISGKSRDAANEQSKRAAQMPRSARSPGKLDELLAVIAEQSVWRKMRYTLPYIAAPFLCVFAVLLLEKPGLADSVGNAWEEFLRSILGMR